MASKKNVAKRVAERKEFVAKAKERGVDAKTARKRYFVQTRAKELEAQGKPVDRAALRKKFESGDVSRKGFGAPKKKAAGTTDSKTRPNVGDAKDYKPPVRKMNLTEGTGDAKDRIKPRKMNLTKNTGDAKDAYRKKLGKSTVVTKNPDGSRVDVGGRSRTAGRIIAAGAKGKSTRAAGQDWDWSPRRSKNYRKTGSRRGY
jgi:hypothetical protein